ncbi:unnamed protein product [Acanthoscelides obtectus]|uniref:Peptidase A1 domain-containing protein n=2 Tax=Acanthoscelides obtectus TaxID=200917 RepID=A0A9P0LNL0_ACAOB|nr:unnamed protein product [Acanthoscelides obtectus]CAK1657388.1 Lysosomal aspartic protease [Acanthoscelides obtectus]
MNKVYLYSWLCAIIPVICSWEKGDGYISIDLIRQKTPRMQYLENPHLADKMGFGEWFHKPKPKPKPGNDSIALYRFLDYEFYAKIVIGHPGQTMNVALDTGWTLSWVLSAKCQVLTTPGCWFHNMYDHTRSSKYKKDGTPYVGNEGKYNLTGFYSYETISVAHSNVTNFRFVEMDNVPWTYLFSKVDGLLGLGIRGPKDDEPFFYALHRENNITNFLFSVYMNRDRQSTHGGNVILGFIQDKHIHQTQFKNGTKIHDKIKFLPVEPGQYWKFSVDKITVKSDTNDTDITTLCPNGCKAISDTSSSTITGPEDEVDKIHELIKAQKFPFGGIWTVSCTSVNKLPEISFVLGGQSFKLKGPNYIIRVRIPLIRTLYFFIYSWLLANRVLSIQNVLKNTTYSHALH